MEGLIQLPPLFATPTSDPAQRCRCKASWFVRFTDDRGEVQATPELAARAFDYGYAVQLGKVPPLGSKCRNGQMTLTNRDGQLVRMNCELCGWERDFDAAFPFG